MNGIVPTPAAKAITIEYDFEGIVTPNPYGYILFKKRKRKRIYNFYWCYRPPNWKVTLQVSNNSNVGNSGATAPISGDFDFIYGFEKRGALLPQAAQQQQAQHDIFVIVLDFGEESVCGERFFGCGTILPTPAIGDNGLIVVCGFGFEN